MAVRGSRKHVLDWTEHPQFIPELLHLLEPVQCKVTSWSRWQPLGYGLPAEARLERFGPSVAPDNPAWADLSSWWLKHSKGANTPNWDIALFCEIGGKPGLVLVEAKANVPELSAAGKRQGELASSNSAENHERIRDAILEAQAALRPHLPGINIDRDRHYQLSNRLAFAWKLASVGTPVVLLYLGFIGDTASRTLVSRLHPRRHGSKPSAITCLTCARSRSWISPSMPVVLRFGCYPVADLSWKSPN